MDLIQRGTSAQTVRVCTACGTDSVRVQVSYTGVSRLMDWWEHTTSTQTGQPQVETLEGVLLSWNIYGSSAVEESSPQQTGLPMLSSMKLFCVYIVLVMSLSLKQTCWCWSGAVVWIGWSANVREWCNCEGPSPRQRNLSGGNSEKGRVTENIWHITAYNCDAHSR